MEPAPNPGPKGKNVKTQKLKCPQEAEAQEAVPVAGRAGVPIRRPAVTGVIVPAAAPDHPVRAAGI